MDKLGLIGMAFSLSRDYIKERKMPFIIGFLIKTVPSRGHILNENPGRKDVLRCADPARKCRETKRGREN